MKDVKVIDVDTNGDIVKPKTFDFNFLKSKKKFDKKAALFVLAFILMILAMGGYWANMMFFKVFGTFYVVVVGIATLAGINNLELK